ncbi:MAG: hypothetical protein IKE03_02570 [Blautia sp.]|nr:hypothetical protein [Blautia sp.]
MIVYENTLSQFKRDVRAKKLANFICAEYESAAGKTASGEMRYACKYAVSLMYNDLERLGSSASPSSGVRIDLEENTHATHLKFIFASSDQSGFRYCLVGLYAGSSVRLTRADDIVCFQEGEKRWTTVHPSMLMRSFARQLFRGVPDEEAGNVTYECAAWLFDCIYSCDTDIITDYNDQITDEYPVIYANDTDELLDYIRPVAGGEGGIDALHRLSSIETLSASRPAVDRNEDQLFLISSITNSVRRGRRAWYIIEGLTGTGIEDIITSVIEKLMNEGKDVQMLDGDEKPLGQPDLVVINQENGGTLDQLEYANVGIFLCDELRNPDLRSFEKDAVLTQRAEERRTLLYISHLKQNVSFADGGKGMRWLVNRLQLASIRREDYDPDLYRIMLVNSKVEFFTKDGQEMAPVTLPATVTFDPATGMITMQKGQKKGIFNALSSGRNGIMILCENPALKSMLRTEISAVRQRRQQIRSFVSELLNEKKDPEDRMDHLSKEIEDVVSKNDSKYSRMVMNSLGKSAWGKLSEQSRTWLISALIVYDTMRQYDRMMDFSGVCVQVSKACELELKRRIFTGFVEYEKEIYGEERYIKKLPDECLDNPEGKQSGNARLLTENKVTLGKLRYIMGLDDNGRIINRLVWHEFDGYARNRLLINNENPYMEMRAQMPVIARIRDDYRNRSAHSHDVSIVEARECIEYVITVSRKLGVLLDMFKS